MRELWLFSKCLTETEHLIAAAVVVIILIIYFLRNGLFKESSEEKTRSP